MVYLACARLVLSYISIVRMTTLSSTRPANFDPHSYQYEQVDYAYQLGFASLTLRLCSTSRLVSLTMSLPEQSPHGLQQTPTPLNPAFPNTFHLPSKPVHLQ